VNALDTLQAVMFEWADRQSVIKPKLYCTSSRRWRLQLVDETDPDSTWYNQHLDDCAKWVEEKLEDWPDCHRKAWDMWDFKHRSDAEKFITLFHLSWVQ